MLMTWTSAMMFAVTELSLAGVVREFGSTIAKRVSTGAGEPEELLRGPFQRLLSELGRLVGVSDNATTVNRGSSWGALTDTEAGEE